MAARPIPFESSLADKLYNYGLGEEDRGELLAILSGENTKRQYPKRKIGETFLKNVSQKANTYDAETRDRHLDIILGIVGINPRDRSLEYPAKLSKRIKTKESQIVRLIALAEEKGKIGDNKRPFSAALDKMSGVIDDYSHKVASGGTKGHEAFMRMINENQDNIGRVLGSMMFEGLKSGQDWLNVEVGKAREGRPTSQLAAVAETVIQNILDKIEEPLSSEEIAAENFIRGSMKAPPTAQPFVEAIPTTPGEFVNPFSRSQSSSGIQGGAEVLGSRGSSSTRIGESVLNPSEASSLKSMLSSVQSERPIGVEQPTTFGNRYIRQWADVTQKAAEFGVPDYSNPFLSEFTEYASSAQSGFYPSSTGFGPTPANPDGETPWSYQQPGHIPPVNQNLNTEATRATYQDVSSQTRQQESDLLTAAQIARQNLLIKSNMLQAKQKKAQKAFKKRELTFEEMEAIRTARELEAFKLKVDVLTADALNMEMQEAQRQISRQINSNLMYGMPLVK